FERLAELFKRRAPKGLAIAQELESSVSDAAFINAYRVPFQFRDHVRESLELPAFADETEGPLVRDLDGNWSYDLGGAYGVNLFGTDFYKQCIARGAERAKSL